MHLFNLEQEQIVRADLGGHRGVTVLAGRFPREGIVFSLVQLLFSMQKQICVGLMPIHVLLLESDRVRSFVFVSEILDCCVLSLHQCHVGMAGRT